MPAPSVFFLFSTLPAQIAARVGSAIVEGEFEPGKRLREVDLAAAFGVSRATVREALRIVEREGLVTIRPQRGARVTTLSTQEVRDVFEIRAYLMGLACRRLAAAPSAVLRRQLTALLRDLEAARNEGDLYARASFAISEFCVRNADSTRLADLVLSFARQTARYTRLSLSTAERRRRSLANWRMLVGAITEGRAVKAERTARQLVLDTRDTAIALLEKRKPAAASVTPGFRPR